MKIVQVLKMVVMGCVASTIVNFFIKPISARKQLRDDIKKATNSLGIMMTMITHSFLSGTEEELQSPAFVNASNQYKAVFKSMVKDLGEAKYEHYVAGTEEAYRIMARVVKSLERLSLDISGLRSAAATQFSLLKQPSGDGVVTPLYPTLSENVNNPIEHAFSNLSAIIELPESGPPSEDGGSVLSRAQTLPSGIQTATTAAAIFSTFIAHLGPPMV